MVRRAFAAGVLLLLSHLYLVHARDVFAQTQSETAASPASAVSKFVGTWTEDLSRRKGAAQILTFRRTGNGGLEELRGSELRPVSQPVNFTGKPYQIDESKNLIAWKQIDSNRFEREIYSGRRLLSPRRIQLSADGKTLTEETAATGAAGEKFVTTIVFQRASGDQGLVGLWKAQSVKNTIPPQVTYEAVGSNGIKMTTRGGNPITVTATLDNKPAPVVGDAVISGTMNAVRQVDASTLEFTQSRRGTVSGKSVRTVSPDGKTMTVTTTNYGPNASKEPVVAIFIKQ
jgi:hypothetical protein